MIEFENNNVRMNQNDDNENENNNDDHDDNDILNRIKLKEALQVMSAALSK